MLFYVHTGCVIARPLIWALVFSISAIAGFQFFGIAEYYDRLFIALLSLLLAYSVVKKDINLASIVVILLCERALDELFFLSIKFTYIKLIAYPIAIWACYAFFYDPITKYLAVPISVSCIASELYWHYTGYRFTDLHYPVILISINLALRHFMFLRTHYVAKLANVQASFLVLDHYIYKLTKYNILLLSAFIIEHLIRHLTPLYPLFIYSTFYTYSAQLITLLLTYYLVEYLFQQRQQFSA